MNAKYRSVKVLDTRSTPYGVAKRRHLLDDGRTMTTYELPSVVLSSVGRKRVLEILSTWQRGEAARAKAQAVRQHVRANPDTKPAALAHELGVSDALIRMRKKEILSDAD